MKLISMNTFLTVRILSNLKKDNTVTLTEVGVEVGMPVGIPVGFWTNNEENNNE